MTASSTLQIPAQRYQPGYGRIGDNRGGGWCSQAADSNDDWLQVYFGDLFTVCRVDTQGDEDSVGWVTAFKLSFSLDGSSWITYKNDNGTIVVRYFCALIINNS